MEQLIHLMDFSRLPQFEVAFQKAHHLVDCLPPGITFRRYKDRIALADFERNELHQAAHLKPFTALTAQKQRRCIFFAEFPCPLDNHGRNAGMYAAFVVNHSFLFIHHLAIVPFFPSLYYNSRAKSANNNKNTNIYLHKSTRIWYTVGEGSLILHKCVNTGRNFPIIVEKFIRW